MIAILCVGLLLALTSCGATSVGSASFRESSPDPSPARMRRVPPFAPCVYPTGIMHELHRWRFQVRAVALVEVTEKRYPDDSGYKSSTYDGVVRESYFGPLRRHAQVPIQEPGDSLLFAVGQTYVFVLADAGQAGKYTAVMAGYGAFEVQPGMLVANCLGGRSATIPMTPQEMGQDLVRRLGLG